MVSTLLLEMIVIYYIPVYVIKMLHCCIVRGCQNLYMYVLGKCHGIPRVFWSFVPIFDSGLMGLIMFFKDLISNPCLCNIFLQ